MTVPDSAHLPIKIAREILRGTGTELGLSWDGKSTLSLSAGDKSEKVEITLPCRPGKLLDALALIQAKAIQSRCYTLGPHLYTPAESSLTDNKTKTVTRLTDKEVDILAALIRAGEEGCTRSFLLESVWGYKTELETHTLETHIYRLRQKLETDPNTPNILMTQDNGYRLIFKPLKAGKTG